MDKGVLGWIHRNVTIGGSASSRDFSRFLEATYRFRLYVGLHFNVTQAKASGPKPKARP
jgi:hypothetical protein